MSETTKKKYPYRRTMNNKMSERNIFGDLLNKLVRRNCENFAENLIVKPQKTSWQWKR